MLFLKPKYYDEDALNKTPMLFLKPKYYDEDALKQYTNAILET